MSKKIRHVTQAISTGHSIVMAQYSNVNKKDMKRLTNRICKKAGMPLLVRGGNTLSIPSHGIEIIRTGYRSIVVCQLTGGYSHVANPTLEQLLHAKFTHFYNETIKQWVSLQEAKEDNDAYDKREAERAAFNVSNPS
ncbi:hypothetical protein COPG_00037 [Colwellia phage 9A]|uniref:Uncharacterized protein n=1 Tax=Colwellia phage 9A TaxID=765765 RepID=I3UMB8_9CAUD|nr:hypothetical protein COPG_00037 [Colwellia phage 9A]AFK66633.1 hypothetical protein COPG_00037 [Colwellia phage 9A]